MKLNICITQIKVCSEKLPLYIDAALNTHNLIWWHFIGRSVHDHDMNPVINMKESL